MLAVKELISYYKDIDPKYLDTWDYADSEDQDYKGPSKYYRLSSSRAKQRMIDLDYSGLFNSIYNYTQITQD